MNTIVINADWLAYLPLQGGGRLPSRSEGSRVGVLFARLIPSLTPTPTLSLSGGGSPTARVQETRGGLA
jgi:hypothetical protein